jgi:hypothetical protein
MPGGAACGGYHRVGLGGSAVEGENAPGEQNAKGASRSGGNSAPSLSIGQNGYACQNFGLSDSGSEQGAVQLAVQPCANSWVHPLPH